MSQTVVYVTGCGAMLLALYTGPVNAGGPASELFCAGSMHLVSLQSAMRRALVIGLCRVQ